MGTLCVRTICSRSAVFTWRLERLTVKGSLGLPTDEGIEMGLVESVGLRTSFSDLPRGVPLRGVALPVVFFAITAP